MSDSVYLLDPEVEALLREIAKDPQSTLLRVKRPEKITDLSDRRVMVGENAPGLTVAERHLLQVYREEVAFLLRYAYWENFLRDGVFELCRFAVPRIDGAVGLKPSPELIEQLERRVKEVRAAFTEEPTLAAIAEVVALFRAGVVYPAQLAAASLRLAPSDSGRMYVGYEQVHAGHCRSASRTFQGVVTHARSLELKAVAHSALGSLAQLQLQSDLSKMYFERAFESTRWPDELLSWFTTSIQAGDLESAARSGELVQSLVGEDSRFLGDWIDARRDERRADIWVPSEHSLPIVKKLRDLLPPAPQAVVGIFDDE